MGALIYGIESPDREVLTDPDALARFEASAERITVAEGDNRTLDVMVLPETLTRR